MAALNTQVQRSQGNRVLSSHFFEKWDSDFVSELKQKERGWQGDEAAATCACMLAQGPGFDPKF